MVPVLGATVGAMAVCMAVFREVGWSWLPQETADQWVVAGVFGVVAGGVTTGWVLRERSQQSEAEARPRGDSAAGADHSRAGGWLWIRRTGRATARRGGKVATGVRGVRADARIRIGRTGAAKASGPGSEASTGIDFGPRQ